jgi:hypothetical protein
LRGGDGLQQFGADLDGSRDKQSVVHGDSSDLVVLWYCEYDSYATPGFQPDYTTLKYKIPH